MNSSAPALGSSSSAIGPIATAPDLSARPVSPFSAALDVANAVLYEGYILFPYTASAGKNRIRWQFGVVVPQAYANLGTGEPAYAQTELLVECDVEASVEILIRFLQVEARQVEAWNGAAFEPVESLVVDGTSYLTFDEGVEREVSLVVRPACESRGAVPIAFGADENLELLRDAHDALRGRVVRRRWPLHGAITVDIEGVAGQVTLRKLRVRIENHSRVVPGERSSALRTAFVSTHTLLRAEHGWLLSVLDPPEAAAVATASLVNRHTWPVLVGDQASDAQRASLVLSSPIILYDFPAVAPQSEGDTFDALEIDELMMLSVRSLSDSERDEAKATDPRARAIVERAERLDAAELGRLHGTLLQGKYAAPAHSGALEAHDPALQPAAGSYEERPHQDDVPPLYGTPPEYDKAFSSGAPLQSDPLSSLDIPGLDCVFVDGVKISKGSSVRLHPKRRADAWDLFLEGKLATVRAIHQDVENLMYVAVTVDDDPASDLHDWYGRSFFFYPDEVTPASPDRPVAAGNVGEGE